MVEIVIKIPKEFEKHYALDRFEDSLQRLRFDAHKSLIAGREAILSGNHEIETLDMLTEAFLNSKRLPKGHDRLIDAGEYENSIRKHYFDNRTVIRCTEIALDNAQTIIKADKENKNADSN